MINNKHTIGVNINSVIWISLVILSLVMISSAVSATACGGGCCANACRTVDEPGTCPEGSSGDGIPHHAKKECFRGSEEPCGSHSCAMRNGWCGYGCYDQECLGGGGGGCTPNCAGKICGQADGCGGSCPRTGFRTGYTNNCDSTDACGQTRSTAPYNSCDLSSNIACGNEICTDQIDNNCNGQVNEGCPPTCTPGYTSNYRCSGANTRQREYRNVDCSLEWRDYDYCAYGCANGACIPGCNPGYTGDYRCNGNVRQREYQYANCSSIWQDYEVCAYGCSNGACSPGCTPGHTGNYRCSGLVRQREYKYANCSTTWQDYETCDYQCSAGSCIDGPDNYCMDSDGGIVYSVQGTVTGIGSDYQSYNKFDYCSGNTVYEYYCELDDWAVISHSCDGNCVDGECHTEDEDCVDECPYWGKEECVGSGTRTCGHYDSDSCLEWDYQSCNGDCCGDDCDDCDDGDCDDDDEECDDVGWQNDYRCSGSWRQRLYTSDDNGDCEDEWQNYEYCSNGCSGDQCNNNPIPCPNCPISCVGEGQSIGVYPGAASCCPGLTAISCSTPNQYGSCAPCVGASICARCGNGICGPGENQCNCPSDCQSYLAAPPIAGNYGSGSGSYGSSGYGSGSSSGSVVTYTGTGSGVSGNTLPVIVYTCEQRGGECCDYGGTELVSGAADCPSTCFTTCDEAPVTQETTRTTQPTGAAITINSGLVFWGLLLVIVVLLLVLVLRR